MFSPRAGTNHGAPRALDTWSRMDVVSSKTPRNNAGAFAAMAAGASHSAVLLSWTRRRASVVTAAAAARQLLWLLDAVAAAAQSCELCVQLACSAPLRAAALLAKVATAMRALESMETKPQRSNRGLFGRRPILWIPSVLHTASSQILRWFLP